MASAQQNPLMPAQQALSPFNGGPADQGLLAKAQATGAQISATNAGFDSPLFAKYRAELNDAIYGTAPTGVKPGFDEALASIYQNQLGRAPDAPGKAYWQEAFNSGTTLQQIAENVALDDEYKDRQSTGIGNLYYDSPMFTGNEWTPQALAGRGLAQQGLSYLPGSAQANPLTAPMGHNNPQVQPTPTAVQPQQNPLLPAPAYAGQTGQQGKDFMAGLIAKGAVDPNDPNFYLNPEWQAYANAEFEATAPMRAAMQKQYDEQGYVGPVGWKTTPTDVLTQQLADNPALREGWRQYLEPSAQASNRLPGIGHNNPPPGPLPTTLTTRPPTRFAAEYPYTSPTNRQVAAANDQRATPMTQPVGFASNNPLLSRFGTARLGEYTGARETPGNTPPAWTPTTNPLPGVINGGQGSSAVAESGPSPSAQASSALLDAAPAIAGLAVPAALSLIAKLPGGAAVASSLQGIFGAPAMADSTMTFGELLKHPTLGQAVGSALAGLPDILKGDYAKGAGATLGSYAGTSAGMLAAGGIGGTLGNFVIPGLGGLVGAYIGRKAGGLFGPGKSVGPNAGGYMAFDPATGQLSGGATGNDNSGGQQEGFVKEFMNGVATVVNEANAKTGGKYVGAYNNARPPAYVEVLKGKINIYDENGVKQVFEGNQIEDAFKHAVDVSTRHSALQLPG